MGGFSGRYGLQFTVHMASEYRAPEIVALARQAHEHGFSQIWVNDNLRYRQQYVLLTAIAAQVPIQVATGITVPYFRNPVDLADTLATLSELTEGREIDVGIARGAGDGREPARGGEADRHGARDGRDGERLAARRAGPLRRLPRALRVLPPAAGRLHGAGLSSSGADLLLQRRQRAENAGDRRPRDGRRAARRAVHQLRPARPPRRSAGA